MSLVLPILAGLFLLAVLVGKRLAYVREEMERRLAEAEVDAELRRQYVYQWCQLYEIPEVKQ